MVVYILSSLGDSAQQISALRSSSHRCKPELLSQLVSVHWPPQPQTRVHFHATTFQELQTRAYVPIGNFLGSKAGPGSKKRCLGSTNQRATIILSLYKEHLVSYLQSLIRDKSKRTITHPSVRNSPSVPSANRTTE